MTETSDQPKNDDRTTRTGGKHPCPSCASRNVAEIRYGFPIPGTFDSPDARAGELILGGCVLWPDRPEYRCHRCSHAWRESPVGR